MVSIEKPGVGPEYGRADVAERPEPHVVPRLDRQQGEGGDRSQGRSERHVREGRDPGRAPLHRRETVSTPRR